MEMAAGTFVLRSSSSWPVKPDRRSENGRCVNHRCRYFRQTGSSSIQILHNLIPFHHLMQIISFTTTSAKASNKHLFVFGFQSFTHGSWIYLQLSCPWNHWNLLVPTRGAEAGQVAAHQGRHLLPQLLPSRNTLHLRHLYILIQSLLGPTVLQPTSTETSFKFLHMHAEMNWMRHIIEFGRRSKQSWMQQRTTLQWKENWCCR